MGVADAEARPPALHHQDRIKQKHPVPGVPVQVHEIENRILTIYDRLVSACKR